MVASVCEISMEALEFSSVDLRELAHADLSRTLDAHCEGEWVSEIEFDETVLTRMSAVYAEGADLDALDPEPLEWVPYQVLVIRARREFISRG